MPIFLLALFLSGGARNVPIDRVQWLGLEPDRVRLAIHLKRDATTAIRNLCLERMTIGGMPFHAEPANASGEIPVTIFFRDLPALKTMLASGRAAIRGTARFVYDVPLLARLVLFTSTANMVVPIQEEVPVEIPGGDWGRAAIRAALEALPPLQNPQRQDGWERQLRHVVLPALVRIDTACGTRAIGFPIAPNRLLTVAEAVQPALFDPALLRATCKLASPQRILRIDTEMEPVFLSLGTGIPVRAQLAKRATLQNMAVLAHPAAAPPFVPATDAALRWDAVAVVTMSPHMDLRFLPARRESGRIVFEDPLDAASLGSPVFSPAGLIGFVQDEHSAAPVSSQFFAQIL